MAYEPKGVLIHGIYIRKINVPTITVRHLVRAFLIVMAVVVVIIFVLRATKAYAADLPVQQIQLAVPNQPVEPKGHFKVCVYDQKGTPVANRDFSIEVGQTITDVVTGFTADDGCRSGEIVVGPARFEIGTGIFHNAIIRDKETVKEQFTFPPFEQNLPQVSAR